jgi:hypothetical protein
MVRGRLQGIDAFFEPGERFFEVHGASPFRVTGHGSAIILDDHRQAGKTENHAGSQRGLPAGVWLNRGHQKHAAAGEKSLMNRAHVADNGIT